MNSIETTFALSFSLDLLRPEKKMPMKNFVGRGAGFGLGAGCGFGVGWGFGGVPIGFAGMGIGGGCGVGLGLGWGFGAAFGAEYLDVQPKFAGNKRPSLLERIGRKVKEAKEHGAANID